MLAPGSNEAHRRGLASKVQQEKGEEGTVHLYTSLLIAVGKKKKHRKEEKNVPVTADQVQSQHCF